MSDGPGHDVKHEDFSETDEIIIKVILGGAWAVGKTSLRRRYLGRGFETTYKQTFGADFALKTTRYQFSDGSIRNISWQIWDIAGQQTFKTLRKMYFYGARAALVVFDVTRPDTLEEAEKWCHEIWEYCGSSTRIPIVLVGNKIDLRPPDFNDDQNMARPEDGKKLAEKLQVVHVETSAKTGENVDLVFETLARELLLKGYLKT